MQIFSNKIGLIHFVGLGGIGMSGIAEVLTNLEFKVTGSDITENHNLKGLNNLHLKIYIGHIKGKYFECFYFSSVFSN